MTDWKDILGNLANSGNLPEGPADEPKSDEPAPKRREKLRVVIDRKGRKGKTATIVEGFQCGDEEIAEIAALLKRRLGTGGASRGGEILIQGDRARDVAQLLREMGHDVK